MSSMLNEWCHNTATTRIGSTINNLADYSLQTIINIPSVMKNWCNVVLRIRLDTSLSQYPLRKVEVVWSVVSISIRHPLDTPIKKVEVIWGRLVCRIHPDTTLSIPLSKKLRWFEVVYSVVSRWIRQTKSPQLFVYSKSEDTLKSVSVTVRPAVYTITPEKLIRSSWNFYHSFISSISGSSSKMSQIGPEFTGFWQAVSWFPMHINWDKLSISRRVNKNDTIR